MPRLQVLNGKRQGATFEVGRGGSVVGHRNTAPISIDDPWISWDHARIFFQGDGFWIEDLGSTNGTFVNCVRVKRERLNHEDIVFFGKTHVIFLVPELAQGSQASSDAPLVTKRSDFELGVERLAAAAEWPAGARSDQPRSPTAANPIAVDTGALPPRRRSGLQALGQDEEASVGPAIPVPLDEISDPNDPLGLRGAPAQLPDVLGSNGDLTDPFNAGADPWAKQSSSLGSSKGLRALSPEADPFASARVDPERDPFGAVRSQAPGNLRPEGTDPFDPRRSRSFAETHHDMGGEAASPVRTNAPGPGIGFEIDDPEDNAVAVPPASAAEVSSLLDGRRSGEDDLDALLGDNAARTPDPGVYTVPRQGPGARRSGTRKASESLTRPVDTAEVARALESDPRARAAAPTPSVASDRPPGARTGPLAARSLPVPAGVPKRPGPPSGTGRFAPELVAPELRPAAPGQKAGPPSGQGLGPNARTQMLVVPPTGPPATSSDDTAKPAVGDLTFEVAKLQDEVRRLRLALDAARAADPERVRVAVEGLRSQELGRQAREIADLRRDLAEAKAGLEKTQGELDFVTEDMIAKEDLIAELRAQVENVQTERHPPRASRPGTPDASGDAFAGSGSGDELSKLEI